MAIDLAATFGDPSLISPVSPENSLDTGEISTEAEILVDPASNSADSPGDIEVGPIPRFEIASADVQPAGLLGECDRCGSTSYRDIAIHAGRSTRRDCGHCGRFIRFVLWYGRPLLN